MILVPVRSSVYCVLRNLGILFGQANFVRPWVFAFVGVPYSVALSMHWNDVVA